MGPEGSAALPSRPKYSWDIKSVPWTDGVGDQHEYFKSVKRWTQFQDLLADGNPNKIDKKIRGIVLQSNLYGRAKDLCEGLSVDEIASENGVNLILSTVYKRDPLSVVTLVFQELQKLLMVRRSGSEQFDEFEMRFGAQLSKFNALGASVALSGSISALILLANADVDSSQRISILAAAAPAKGSLTTDASTDEFIKKVSYETIASVLRQCDRPESSNYQQYASVSSHSANLNPSRNFIGSGSSSNTYGRPNQNGLRGSFSNQRSNERMSSESIQEKKARSQCSRCGKYGHWYNDHNNDGSLRNDVMSSDEPIKWFNISRDRQSNKNKNRAVQFNMANLTTHFNTHNVHTVRDGSPSIGPMIDNGAPYSAIGQVELKALMALVCGSFGETKIESIPAAFKDRPYWQYGVGEHSSEIRPILGSVLIDVNTNSGTIIQVRHLVLSGSSQWVFGRNITSKSNIMQLDGTGMVIPGYNGQRITLPLIEYDMHIYLPLSLFINPTQHELVHALSSSAVETSADTICKIVDKVHRHVCGHATYSDIKTLLQRNNIWCESVKDQLQKTIDECTHCRAAAKPQPSRKVSLSSLNRSFNEVVCIDHFFLDGQPILHVMDATTRYSAALVVPNTSLEMAVLALETSWLSQFWAPITIIGDDAFNHTKFIEFTNKIGSEFKALPPRRHSKNVLESKHSIIRSIFTRLKFAEPHASKHLLAQQSVTCSNDVYGSNTLSAFEMAKGFTKPVLNNVYPVSEDIIEAQQTLSAKRKLALILSSKAPQDINLSPGDLVEVYIKKENEKRGKWSSPKIILAFDYSTSTVTLPASNGKTMRAAIEDLRHPIPEDSFAHMIREANDELDNDIDDIIASFNFNSTDPTHVGNQETNANNISMLNRNKHNPPLRYTDDSLDSNEFASSVDTTIVPNTGDQDTNTCADPEVGEAIEVYWPLDDSYFPGVVAERIENGKHIINYTDGDIEVLRLSDEIWRHTLNTETQDTENSSPSIDQTSTPNNTIQLDEVQPEVPEETNNGSKNTASTATALTANVTTLQSNLQTVLQDMFKHFGNKAFPRYKCQGFPTFPLLNSYQLEECSFKKSVKCVPKSKVPKYANIINSHTIYKIKHEDDKSLKLKARIAPHGNEDYMKDEMRSDCSMCSPVGMRILLSTATVRKWYVTKLDVKSAFLQTGNATRDVYVIPPSESTDRGKCLWLLLAASYGLVNANAKWQVLSDSLLIDLGFEQLVSIPQLFIIKKNNELKCILAKIVDDIILAGHSDTVENVIKQIDDRYKLGTIASGPGALRFFGINIIQNVDYSIETNADDKLEALTPYPLSRHRRHIINDLINPIEKKSFASLNASIGWIGITSSIFCAEFSSRMQQQAPNATVKQLVNQTNGIKLLKKLGTTVNFVPPKIIEKLSVLVFSDAGRACDKGQLCYIAGILFGDFTKGNIFHCLSWSSHKAKRPVRSIGAAETIAAGEAIDEGKVLAETLATITGNKVSLIVALDTKDLFSALSTQRNSIDKSIRADVNVIRYEFECENITEMIWIPGSQNLADPGTKENSPLIEALQILLFTGKLPIDFKNHESALSNKPLG